MRVLEGTVLDVAVDARPESETFGQFVMVELSAENKRQLYVPRGFFAWFLRNFRISYFFYKCDNYYHKLSEEGFIH